MELLVISSLSALGAIATAIFNGMVTTSERRSSLVQYAVATIVNGTLFTLCASAFFARPPIELSPLIALAAGAITGIPLGIGALSLLKLVLCILHKQSE